MKWFLNLRIGKKIIGLVVVMALFMGGIGYVGYYNTIKADQAMESMYGECLLPIKWINELRTHNRANQANLLELILSKDPSQQKLILEDLEKRARAANELLTAYEKQQLDPVEAEKLAMIKESLANYRGERTKVIELALSGKSEEAFLAFQAAKKSLNAFNQSLRELAEHNAQKAEQINAKNSAQGSAAQRMILGILFLALVLALIFGAFIAKLISNSLEAILRNVEVVAQGNLMVEEIPVVSQDEIGKLSLAFNAMNNSLRNLVQQLAQAAEQVTASSQELSGASDESARASDQIASNLQEINNSAEQTVVQTDNVSATALQISAGIQQVAANSQAVADNARQANESAKQGNQEVLYAIEQMGSISSTVENLAGEVKTLGERSQEIGKIVEVITGIASQTNLLALNAAIEAARAGEQGKGFAVVAEEVRKLAEQSGAAAEQIAKLIKEIQGETERVVFSMEKGTGEVKEGIMVVDRAGNSFQTILTAVEEVSSQVQDISAAIEEMATGTNNLANSVNQIGENAKHAQEATREIAASAQEQNATLEEIASSSELLSNMAANLQTLVAGFKIKHTN